MSSPLYLVEKSINTDGVIETSVSYGTEDTELNVWYDTNEMMAAFTDWSNPDPSRYYNTRKFSINKRRLKEADKSLPPPPPPSTYRGRGRGGFQNSRGRGNGRGRGNYNNRNNNNDYSSERQDDEYARWNRQQGGGNKERPPSQQNLQQNPQQQQQQQQPLQQPSYQQQQKQP